VKRSSRHKHVLNTSIEEIELYFETIRSVYHSSPQIPFLPFPSLFLLGDRLARDRGTHCDRQPDSPDRAREQRRVVQEGEHVGGRGARQVQALDIQADGPRRGRGVRLRHQVQGQVPADIQVADRVAQAAPERRHLGGRRECRRPLCRRSAGRAEIVYKCLKEERFTLKK